MAKPLKEAGITEIEALEKRIRRQHTLKRISDGDAESLLRNTTLLKKHIGKMEEGE